MAQALAVDISLASLLGKDVYNFGELLMHPIVRPLASSWVGEGSVRLEHSLMLQALSV